MKKYKLTNQTIEYKGRTLYQIQARKSFAHVSKGDLGGYIEKEDNLSHKGNAWVSENAMIFDQAKIVDNAWISDSAKVYGHAEVSGYARIYGESEVCGDAQIGGNAEIGQEKITSSLIFEIMNHMQEVTPSVIAEVLTSMCDAIVQSNSSAELSNVQAQTLN